MIELNEIESKYLDLMGNKISIKEFENWVYNSTWLEEKLTEDEYMDLISLNYRTPSSRHEIGKILKERLNKGKFETVKMVKLLNEIIERNGNEGEALVKLYHQYCSGYRFLQDLGLGIGLNIYVPNKYGVEYFDDLNKSQKDELVGSAYPAAHSIAIELKNWLLRGELKLTGKQKGELNRWEFIDNRKEQDKISRVWKIGDIDKETGKIMSRINMLLNKNGDFKNSENN